MFDCLIRSFNRNSTSTLSNLNDPTERHEAVQRAVRNNSRKLDNDLAIAVFDSLCVKKRSKTQTSNDLKDLGHLNRKFPKEVGELACSWMEKRLKANSRASIPLEIAFLVKNYDWSHSCVSETGVRAALMLPGMNTKQSRKDIVDKLARDIGQNFNIDVRENAVKTLLALCETTQDKEMQDAAKGAVLRLLENKLVGLIADVRASLIYGAKYILDSKGDEAVLPFVRQIARLSAKENTLPTLERSPVLPVSKESAPDSPKEISTRTGFDSKNIPEPVFLDTVVVDPPFDFPFAYSQLGLNKLKEKLGDKDGTSGRISSLTSLAFDKDKAKRDSAARELVDLFSLYPDRVGRQLGEKMRNTLQEPHPIVACMVVLDNDLHQDNHMTAQRARRLAFAEAGKRDMEIAGLLSMHRLVENNELNSLRSQDFTGPVYYDGARSTWSLVRDELDTSIQNFAKSDCPYFVASLIQDNHFATLFIARDNVKKELNFTILDTLAPRDSKTQSVYPNSSFNEIKSYLDNMKFPNGKRVFTKSSHCLQRLQKQDDKFTSPLDKLHNMQNSCGLFGLLLAEAIQRNTFEIPGQGNDSGEIAKEFSKMFNSLLDSTKSKINLSWRLKALHAMFDSAIEYNHLLY